MAASDNAQSVSAGPVPQPQEKKVPTVHQTVAAIMSDGIPLAYNELADATCALGPTPWNDAKASAPGRRWTTPSSTPISRTQLGCAPIRLSTML